jgi:hypothetical protein
VRSLRRLAILALCGGLAVGNSVGVAHAKAANPITGQVLVNPLTAIVSVSAVRVEQGQTFQALGLVGNEGDGALSDLGLELRGDGQLVIDAATRSLPTLAGRSAHQETWSVCGTQPGSYLLLVAADAIGAGWAFSVESQVVLVEVTPADRVCGGFSFDGFFSPIENPPTVNVATAGKAIPVKFSLGGDHGLQIFDTGSPGSALIACDSTAPLDAVEETVASGSSGLSFDAATGVYTYVWKTKKPWAGTCRQLLVRLIDGSVHRATFKFRS